MSTLCSIGGSRVQRPLGFGLEASFERNFALGYSDTAALLKVSRVLPTNLIVAKRLGALKRPRDDGNADFSPMSRTQLLTAKPHACFSALGETASPR